MAKYVLTKQEISDFAGVSKTHFLNDNAQRTSKSLGDLTGITGFGFHLVEIQPGYESTEFHKHYHEDECVYVLEGTAEAQVGNDVYQVVPGDFIGYRAAGEAHMLRNNGADVFKCIVVGQRLDHDVADYPRQGKRIYRQKHLPWDLVDMEHLAHPNAGKKI